jgi:hypothetical protein
MIPKFGSHLASSITRADIASIHADVGKEHPYAANRFVSIVQRMFNVGRQLGLVPEHVRNPATEIVPFPEKKRRRYVTLAEMPLLAAAIDEDDAVLNHKDQKTTAGYAYFQTEDRQRALDRHGQAIVELTQGGMRRINDNRPAATGSKDAKTSRLPRVHRICRNDLYDLIWSEPITTLAQRFGISDVGLAKVCRRSDIPAPTRGYWARIAAGDSVPRPELPERADLGTRAIRFRVNRGPRADASSSSPIGDLQDLPACQAARPLRTLGGPISTSADT